MEERRVIRPELDGLDAADVRAVRAGNSLMPGLACFTGVSFFVYLVTKGLSGAAAVDVALMVQIVVSAALAGGGGGLLARGRYFSATLETDTGPIRLTGLSKAEQRAIVARYGPPESPNEGPNEGA